MLEVGHGGGMLHELVAAQDGARSLASNAATLCHTVHISAMPAGRYNRAGCVL